MTTSETSTSDRGEQPAETRLTKEEALAMGLGALLERVEQGETIVLMQDSERMATISPEPRTKRPMSEVIDEIIAFGKAHPLSGMTYRELIEDGRRI